MLKTAWKITAKRRWYARPLHVLNWWLQGGRTTRMYRLARWLEGARPVRMGRFDLEGGSTVHGNYSRPHIGGAGLSVSVTFSGACPVQGEGHVFGRPCYYRSRGEGWQFYVASSPAGSPLADDAWCYYENPYMFPEGGWVHADVSLKCIARAVHFWESGHPGSSGPGHE